MTAFTPDWDEIHDRSAARMAQVDAMPPEVRRLIHAHNVNPVVDCYSRGLTDVADIRDVLELRAKKGDAAAQALFHERMAANAKAALERRKAMRAEVLEGDDGDEDGL